MPRRPVFVIGCLKVGIWRLEGMNFGNGEEHASPLLREKKKNRPFPFTYKDGRGRDQSHESAGGGREHHGVDNEVV